MSTCFRLPPPATRLLSNRHRNARAFGNHQSFLTNRPRLSATQTHLTCGASPLCLHKSCQRPAYPRTRCVTATCSNVTHAGSACVVDEAWNDILVVVEGLSDQRAVRKAVSAQVFVLHGASKSSAAATAQLLKQRASKGVRVVALLDPDVAGRQSRTIVDSCLSGQCLHAFIPVHQATAASDIRRKSAGDVGVEHATPMQIRQALTNPRPSCPGRKEFCRADLVSWGLVVEMGTSSSQQVGCVQRRAAVSALLGLGNCDGKQLLRQLNMYGFCRADVAKALQAITGTEPASSA